MLKYEEEPMKKLSERKGITLVALVITIIILLILAAITINLTIGQRGILTRAQEAGKNYTNAQDKELADLEDLYSSMMVATGDDATITISMKKLKEIIKDEINSMSPNFINNTEGYSTTERVVGKWVDGKPLYKKTWIKDSPISVSNSAWTDTTISIAENNIAHLIKAEAVGIGTSENNDVWALHAHANDSATNIMVLAARDGNPILCKYFTFYYTKTTDMESVE